MSNWDSDTAPYPIQPAYGAAPDEDDGAWLDPVTYDQTDYQGLDAYLEPDGMPSPYDTLVDGARPRDPAGFPFPGAVAADYPAPDLESGDTAGDEYAGYDDFAYQGLAPDAHPAEDSYPDYPDQGGLPYPGQEELAPDVAGSAWDDPYGRVRPAYQARRPRWLIVGACAVAAAALGFGVVIVTHTGNASLPSSALPLGTATPGGVTSPGGMASTAAPPRARTSPAAAVAPPLTQAQAQQVLTAYTTANNTANALLSQTRLAGVETGSSLAIDAGIYREQQAGGAPYPAYGPVRATYYIPLESPAAYPHWFAVHVKNALLSAPGKVISGEYLVFTQAAAGAPWLDAMEPFVVNAAAEPSIALDSGGYATAVTATDASLVLSPAAASGATATALSSGTGQPANPGNLADFHDFTALRRTLPPHASITGTHLGSGGPFFGLRTTDGGALLFYDVAARISLTAPPGGTLPLDVPGFFTPASRVATATLDYLEQFATYDPPRGHGTLLPVVADYSGITGQG